MNLAIDCTKGSKASAINVLTPVCTNAICFVIPVGQPSLTSRPAIQTVPVVPTFAPNIAAIAEGSGRAPLATSPITAVVVKDELCHRSVHTMAPKNIQYGFPRHH